MGHLSQMLLKQTPGNMDLYLHATSFKNRDWWNSGPLIHCQRRLPLPMVNLWLLHQLELYFHHLHPAISTNSIIFVVKTSSQRITIQVLIKPTTTIYPLSIQPLPTHISSLHWTYIIFKHCNHQNYPYFILDCQNCIQWNNEFINRATNSGNMEIN